MRHDAEGKSLSIEWSDGHKSNYDMNWLYRNAYGPRLCAPKPREINLWGASLAENLPTTHFDEVDGVRSLQIMTGDKGLLSWLVHIEKFGVGRELVERIAFIRKTHYGDFWDFTADLAHGDTAYTTLALPAHTDTTYFTDPIGLQFFHLLKHQGSGGSTLLVDGFNVALQLQASQPWAFQALTQLKISSHAAGDKDQLLQPSPLLYPIIGLDPSSGHLHQIRFNNDDRSTLSLEATQVELFYAALQEWTKLVKKQENELWVRLTPGRAVIMDNWRVMHGRSSFTGYRRMVGAYVGWDDYQSRLKTLVYKSKDRL
ncbi:hypothetical protein HDV03_000729 [Kappamyces sp. JEL0829]|nr:hypothetical protein HDV03_000729 [Kappamyces sp. JEL0829]